MNWNSIIDIVNLEAVDELGGSFLDAKPFPFVVIDNFLRDKVAKIKLSISPFSTESTLELSSPLLKSLTKL